FAVEQVGGGVIRERLPGQGNDVARAAIPSAVSKGRALSAFHQVSSSGRTRVGSACRRPCVLTGVDRRLGPLSEPDVCSVCRGLDPRLYAGAGVLSVPHGSAPATGISSSSARAG